MAKRLNLKCPLSQSKQKKQFRPFAEISAELPPEAREPTPEPVQEEIADEHVGDTLLPDEELTTLPVPEHSEVAQEGPEPALEIPLAALPEPPKPEPEFELDQDFELILEPEPVVPAHEMLSEIPVVPPAPKAVPEEAPAMHAMEQRRRARRRAREWHQLHFRAIPGGSGERDR